MSYPTPQISSARWPALVVLALSTSASAQGYYGGYYGNGTSGRVIAGIVIAISATIILLICFSLMCRRRRRGLTALPTYNASLWSRNGQNQNQNQNQNQGPYSSYPMANQQSQPWGRYQPPPGRPEDEQPPPPPYPGKPKGYDGEENSGYGFPEQQQTAPSPGGFVAPQSPGAPQPAHVNTNSPWFRSS